MGEIIGTPLHSGRSQKFGIRKIPTYKEDCSPQAIRSQKPLVRRLVCPLEMKHQSHHSFHFLEGKGSSYNPILDVIGNNQQKSWVWWAK
jgi:hypothetical protein